MPRTFEELVFGELLLLLFGELHIFVQQLRLLSRRRAAATGTFRSTWQEIASVALRVNGSPTFESQIDIRRSRTREFSGGRGLIGRPIGAITEYRWERVVAQDNRMAIDTRANVILVTNDELCPSIANTITKSIHCHGEDTKLG